MRSRWIGAAALIAALLGGSFGAEGSTFELSGTVLDESGVGLSGATLVLVHQETGQTRSTISGDTGYYLFPAVPHGTYSLEVRLAGYASLRFAGLRYFADTKPIFNVTLRLREVQESMTFTGEAPLLNVSQSQVGLSIEERQLRDLPLSSRDYLDLVELEGSARELPEGPPGEHPPHGAPRISVNGASPHDTGYELDGFQNTRDQHGVVLIDAGLDGVEEFRVVSGPFSAEYGRSLAGVVSASTETGGNDWRGTLSAFVHPGSWDAGDPLTSEDTALDRQDLGFTLGGPIIREKTHLFGSLEYGNQEETVVVTAPLDSGRFRGLYELPSDRLRGLFKLLHELHPRHRLSVRASAADHEGEEGAGGYDIFENRFDVENDDFSFAGTLSSELGESARSELRVGFASESFSATADPPPLGPAIRDPLRGNIGSPTRLERADERHFELAEVIAFSRGTHALTSGFSFLRIESTSEVVRFTDGLVLVPAVGGAPTLTWRAEGNAGPLERSESHLQAFLQDDWQVSPFLTLNLGLRWEKETSVPDDDNFGPRIGFHWDATRDGLTSVRGGYGIFYSRVVSIVDSLERLYGPSGLAVFAEVPGGAVVRAPNFYGIEEDRRSPRAQQVSVGFEREWAPAFSVAVDASYVRGANLLLPRDANAPSFFDYASGARRSAAAADATRPSGVSTHRDLYLLGSRGSSRFWSVEVRATKRYQTSFMLQASYQWSRSRNDGDDFRVEASLPLNPDRPDLEWGRSAFDIPHFFVGSGVWDAPFGLRVSALLRARSGRPVDPRVEADLDGDLKLRERASSGGQIFERNSFRGPSFASLDGAVAKIWELAEGRSIEGRFEVFNVTSRLNPLQVLSTYGASETPLPQFLEVVEAASPRQFQLSVRFQF